MREAEGHSPSCNVTGVAGVEHGVGLAVTISALVYVDLMPWMLVELLLIEASQSEWKQPSLP